MNFLALLINPVAAPCPTSIPPALPADLIDLRYSFSPIGFVPNSYHEFYCGISNILESISQDCVHPILIHHCPVMPVFEITVTEGNHLKNDYSDDIFIDDPDFETRDPHAYDPHFVPEDRTCVMTRHGPSKITISIRETNLPDTYMITTRQYSGAMATRILREFNSRIHDIFPQVSLR